MVDKPGHELTSDLCVIPDVGFFVRAVLPIPVKNSDEEFPWGIWVSQSEANFGRWRDDLLGVDDEPTFGWFANDLPGYQPSTLDVKTMVHPQSPGWRPLVELEPTDHPLAVEYRGGITVDRAFELAHLATGGIDRPS